MVGTLAKTEPLIQALLDMKEYQLPFRTVYKLTKLLEAAEKHRAFYNESLKKLVEQYGEKDESGEIVRGDNQGSFKIQEDLLQEFGQRFDELMLLEVDYPDLTFEEYELDGVNLNMLQVSALMPFLNMNI